MKVGKSMSDVGARLEELAISDADPWSALGIDPEENDRHDPESKS